MNKTAITIGAIFIVITMFLLGFLFASSDLNFLDKDGEKVVFMPVGEGVPVIRTSAVEITPSPKSTRIPPTVTPTATPDPCSKENIISSSDSIAILMIEFDDVAFLASYVPQNKLDSYIQQMQDVRRRLQKEDVPVCLVRLKGAGINYMNVVISNMTHFLAGFPADVLEQDIQNVKNYRGIYDQELIAVANVAGLEMPLMITPTKIAAAEEKSTEPADLSTSPTVVGQVEGPAEVEESIQDNALADGNSGVVTTTRDLYMRVGPGTVHLTRNTYAAGSELQVLGKASGDEWLLVKAADDLEGWMTTAYLDGVGNFDKIEIAEVDNAILVNGVVVSGNGIAVPGVQITLYQRIDDDTILRVRGTSNKSGEFYLYIPVDSSGVWVLEVEGVNCNSVIANENCEYDGAFEQNGRFFVDLDEPQSPYTIVYQEDL